MDTTSTTTPTTTHTNCFVDANRKHTHREVIIIEVNPNHTIVATVANPTFHIKVSPTTIDAH